MIQMKEKTLASFLQDAIDRASDNGTAQLISWTKKIEALSMIGAFKRTEHGSDNRLFWTNSKQDFILFGLGTTTEVVALENRFEQLEEKWAELIESALIYNPYKKQGTGLTAIGGMRFDPLEAQGELWANFPLTILTVPEYLIVNEADDYYATFNRYVQPEDDVEAILAQVNEVVNLLSTDLDKPTLPKQKIENQIEKDPEAWKESVQKAVDTIKVKKAQKIVLARELRLKLNNRVQVSSLVEKLLITQPQSYIFAYEQGDDCFVGASPERLVQVQGDELLSTCLAGTAARGKDEEEDKQIADAELVHNAKNREEHDHVVQMIKSSISPFCHDINIPNQPTVLTLRNLQHLYTPVRGRLNNGVSVFNLIEVLHPTPTVGGVPTEKALKCIREEEKCTRGWYGAPIGWLDYNGN